MGAEWGSSSYIGFFPHWKAKFEMEIVFVSFSGAYPRLNIHHFLGAGSFFGTRDISHLPTHQRSKLTHFATTSGEIKCQCCTLALGKMWWFSRSRCNFLPEKSLCLGFSSGSFSEPMSLRLCRYQVTWTLSTKNPFSLKIRTKYTWITPNLNLYSPKVSPKMQLSLIFGYFEGGFSLKPYPYSFI